MTQWHWFKARSPSLQVLLSLPCLTLLVKLSQLASALAATLVVLVLTGFAVDSSRVAVFCDGLPEVLAGLDYGFPALPLLTRPKRLLSAVSLLRCWPPLEGVLDPRHALIIWISSERRKSIV